LEGVEHQQFWALIDAARVTPGKRAVVLGRALKKLTAEEIAAFDAWFGAYHAAIDRRDLQAAVHAIRGGCDDDAFGHFRSWLVGRGEAAVTGAIADPESLATIIGRADARDELLLGAAGETYRAVAGGEPPARASVTIPGRAEWPADRIAAGVTLDDAFFAATYPKLHAAFLVPKPAKVPRAPRSSKPASPRVEKATVAADLSRPVRTYAASEQYAPGDRVAHPTFGEGVVQHAEPGKVTIAFPAGHKVLAHSKAGASTAGAIERPKPFDISSAAGGWFVDKA
jgi:hypothetical protein